MRRFLLGMVTVVCMCTFVYAQDFNALTDAAKQSYQAQDLVKAAQQLKEALLSIWDEMPLTAVNPRLVTDTQTYATRESNTYGSGESIYISAEIYGAKIKKTGQAYLVDSAVDFYLLDAQGAILGGKQDFAKFSLVSAIPNTEFHMNLTYTVSAPTGSYTVQTVVRDLNSGKSTKFTNAIEIK